VTNLASRLADEATAGQILISQRLYAEVEDEVKVEPVGEFTLKGFQRPVAAFNVLAVREPATNDPSFRSISTNGEAAEPARKVRATD
jgi:class 3 adenylate cyclase